MITGYSQHGRLDEARVLFESFGGKNVRTWTALLTGYAKNGRVEEARLVFDDMPERNIVSWNAMVSGYVQNGDLWNARKLFDEMPERNVASWNSIVGGYCRLCVMDEARGLFDGMPERNSVSWMVMISGYVESSGFREAWILFVRMHRSGCRPDQSVFVVAISAITGLNDLELLLVLRTVAMKTGHEEDVVVGTAILNAYTRCGCLEVAMQFFELMPERNEYSWTSMIAAFSQCGKFDNAIALYNRVPEKCVSMKTVAMTAYARIGRIGEAKRIFDEIPTPNVIAWNSMVAGYAQNGMLEEAKDLFLRMPMRNSASWAAMIAGLVLNGRSKEAFNLLAELHRSGAVPSPSTFTSILSACAGTGAIEMGRQLHCLSIKAGCQFNQHVGNGLMSMYAKCKNMEDVSQVFSKMRRRDTVSWNSLITGYSENNMLGDARNTFEKMPERDVVSWTAIISAYVQSDQGEIALELFLGMLANGIKPNELAVTSLLSTCGSLGFINLGEQFHALICKLGFDSFICVGNSLITMYFKCGCEDGVSAFEEMGEKDIVTWNAILAGCAQNGFGDEAIKIFEKMKGKGVVPDHISFLGLLSACSHSGLVDEGLNYFTSMTQDYGIMPLVQHYTCMVDLLGRAGRLSIAESVIENIPVEPDLVIWEALLVACRIHRNFKLGQKVAERLIQMGTEKYGPYVLLLDIYASQGMQDKVGEIQKAMFDQGVSEKPGFSWIQIKSKLHCFLTGDETHNQIQGIHTELMNFYGNF